MQSENGKPKPLALPGLALPDLNALLQPSADLLKSLDEELASFLQTGRTPGRSRVSPGLPTGPNAEVGTMPLQIRRKIQDWYESPPRI